MSELLMAKKPNLGFGNMRMPTRADGSVDTETIFKMVDYYMEHGFNYFDTGYTYKGSEEMLNKALVARYPRESFMITTKLNLYECSCAEDMEKQFRTSKERLGVDYIDTYFLHGIGPAVYDKIRDWKAFDYIRSLKKEGMVRHIGFSFHSTADDLDRLLTENPDMELVQLQLNYLDWDDPKVQSRLNYETARKHGKPISVMEPCKGGWLAGDESAAAPILKEYDPDASVASWAFRFIAGLEGIFVILSGMGNLDQVVDNVHTFETFRPLTAGEREQTLRVVEKIHNSPRLPCTGCRYCSAACPQDLPVQFYISTYNDILTYNSEANAKHLYNMLIKPETRASNCIGCGTCEQRCPQGIEITKYIPIIAEKMDP